MIVCVCEFDTFSIKKLLLLLLLLLHNYVSAPHVYRYVMAMVGVAPSSLYNRIHSLTTLQGRLYLETAPSTLYPGNHIVLHCDTTPASLLVSRRKINYLEKRPIRIVYTFYSKKRRKKDRKTDRARIQHK